MTDAERKRGRYLYSRQVGSCTRKLEARPELRPGGRHPSMLLRSQRAMGTSDVIANAETWSCRYSAAGWRKWATSASPQLGDAGVLSESGKAARSITKEAGEVPM